MHKTDKDIKLGNLLTGKVRSIMWILYKLTNRLDYKSMLMMDIAIMATV